jgi:S-adenosylmethionine:tRNA ribosyltransferase-isomerase
MFTLEDFEYSLPPELVAQHPSAVRSASRLLAVRGRELADRRFSELPDLLSPGDLLVFNDTRVIKARLLGRKASGGKIELLVERIVGTHEVLAQLRASKPPSAGTRLVLEDCVDAEVEGRTGELYRVRFEGAVDEVLESRGRVPLPPYIGHAAQAEDESRYQTVYAREPGAVAAPTAGLHFDDQLLERLRIRGVRRAWLTLHGGAGTFQPVRVSNLEKHIMHSERYSIPEATSRAVAEAKSSGAHVVAVGTTSVRALESAAVRSGEATLAGEGETRLFITPGYRFRVVDRLITNFHLPRSTLLMLVCAFGGMREVLHAYDHAVRERYRFFSYGDAMLLERAAS